MVFCYSVKSPYCLAQPVSVIIRNRMGSIKRVDFKMSSLHKIICMLINSILPFHSVQIKYCVVVYKYIVFFSIENIKLILKHMKVTLYSIGKRRK